MRIFSFDVTHTNNCATHNVLGDIKIAIPGAFQSASVN